MERQEMPKSVSTVDENENVESDDCPISMPAQIIKNEPELSQQNHHDLSLISSTSNENFIQAQQ